jgi:signal transduction histidine kinase
MTNLSLRVRLTLWYTLALVLIMCVLGADVSWGIGRLGLLRIDRELDGVAQNVTNIVRGELAERDRLIDAASEACSTLALAGDAIAILDTHGSPIAASWDALSVRQPLPTAESGPLTWTEQMPAGAWRVHARPQSIDGNRFVLIVARSLIEVRRERRELLEAMEVAIPLVLVLAAGGGFWLASVGLQPVTEMAARAARIPLDGIEDLGHANRRDELGQLAGAFNGLVQRLRAALETQRQFMADASHELRTPVSIVRVAAEVSLSRDERQEGEYREALAIVGDQAQRLSRLVDNMLILARADVGGYPLHPVDLYIDEIVVECCRAVDVLSTARRVTFQTSSKTDTSDMTFRGDEDLLRQLVVNVLQNAVQHSPEGGTVSIELDRSSDGLSVRVTDSGPGIPSADRDRIFDRFVQLDRARRGAGAGLGLPIARWIAEVHHGSLVLEESGPAGSTFRITLPDPRSGRADEARTSVRS